MVNILTKKQAGTSLSVIDALGLSAMKSLVVDGLISPVINRFSGGNTLLTGLGKILGAGAVGTVFGRNKIGGLAATALVISAGDDFFRPLVASLSGGTSGNNASASRRPAGDDSFGGANVGQIRMRPI